MIKHLPSICKALGYVFRTTNTQKVTDLEKLRQGEDPKPRRAQSKDTQVVWGWYQNTRQFQE